MSLYQWATIVMLLQLSRAVTSTDPPLPTSRSFLKNHWSLLSLCLQKADLVFIIDCSESVDQQNTTTLKKNFIKDVMKALLHLSTPFNAAVVLYGTNVTLEYAFDEPFNLQAFHAAVDRLHSNGNLARFDKALQFASDSVFVNESKLRPDVPKIALLVISKPLTLSTDNIPLSTAAESLKQKGVRIVVVAIGGDVKEDELLEIAEWQSDIMRVAEFSSLLSHVASLKDKICDTVDNPRMFLDASVSEFRYLLTGKEESFHCYATGNPMPSIKWWMNGKEIKDGYFNQTIRLEKIQQREIMYLGLHITEVSQQHEGNYTCEASNIYHVKRSSVSVSVSCSPPLFKVSALRPVVSISGNAVLSCEIYNIHHKDAGSLAWFWKFNGHRIQNNHKYNASFDDISSNGECLKTKSVMSLHISTVSKNDIGRYTCELWKHNTTMGKDEIYLTEGMEPYLPREPKDMTALVFDCGTSIEVKWQSPPFGDVRRPITGYEIQIQSDNDWLQTSTILSSGNYSHVFRELRANEAYEIKVRAKNAIGFGPWAKQQIVTTADRPKATDVSFFSFDCTIRFGPWDPPPENECPILRYALYYRETYSETSKGEWIMKVLEGVDACTFRFAALNCSTNYDLVVVAWNERGPSNVNDGLIKSIQTDKGQPLSPSILNVVQGKCGAPNVTWELTRTDFGGGPVTRYETELKSGNTARYCTSPAGQYNCLFEGALDAGTYDVRVRAVNRAGPSEWSEKTINITATGPPEVPVILNDDSDFSGFNITLRWSRPSMNNCPITMYNVYYRIIDKLPERNWTLVNVTNPNINNYRILLELSQTYEFKVSAWNKFGEGEASKAWIFKSALDVPFAPDLLQAEAGECASIKITWEPPSRENLGEPVTSYLAQVKRAGTLQQWQNCTSLNAPLKRSCLFVGLTPSAWYEVRVRARNNNGYGLSSNQTIRTTVADKPETPIIRNKETNVPTCDVTLYWTTPSSNGCPILLYTVSYRQKSTTDDERPWIMENVTDTTSNLHLLLLNCSNSYEFEVYAWNVKGISDPPPKAWPISTVRQDSISSPGSYNESDGVDIPLAVIGLILVVSGLALIVTCYRRRVKSRLKRVQREIQVLENCEIPPVRVVFSDNLGLGAFGKVYKAELKEGLDYFTHDPVGSVKARAKTVAVKVLHDHPSEDEKREILREIELMKEVGKHKNVLSFLGCWTTSEPLLLIIEYVAHGDLLHWLRRRRRQRKIIDAQAMETSVNEDDQCTQYATEDQYQENPILNYKSRDEISTLEKPGCVNEDDAIHSSENEECDEDCNTFYPSDLMSFAWQIARGMSYLSEKGLFHRDLAARNVLVGHGKLLKIADFGLMREAYDEIYEVKTQKKLPIKWMAPESLYEQVYTAKSDVWSYGVVLWEIATVGGTPYPSRGNRELLSLLKSGYRMEKPELCSDQYYSMMRECWSFDPDERPSFQELTERLEVMMVQDVEYFDFDKLDDSKYYDNFVVEEDSSEETTAL